MIVRINSLLIIISILSWQNSSLAATSAHVVYPNWFKETIGDLQSDLEDAQDVGKKGIMVFFSTKTCSYCQAIIEKAFREKDIVQQLRKNYDVIGLEVFSDIEVVDPLGKSHWAKEFAVAEKAKFTPTMIFYGNNGLKQLRLIGYQSPKKMRAVLNYLEGDNHTRMSLRQYMKQNESVSKSLIKKSGRTNLKLPKNYNKHLMLVFESVDCSKCQLLREMLKAAVMQAYLKHLDVVYIKSSDTQHRIVTPEGDEFSGKTWADKLGLIHSPAMVFYSEMGSEVIRVDTDILLDKHGNKITADDKQVLDNLRARLQYVVEKGYIDLPQFQRWRAQRNKQERLQRNQQ